MGDKFEINWNHYFTDKNKSIYAENRDKRKALHHLETYLSQNSIMSIATIDDLFNYLEDIFDNSYKNKYIME